uniref:RagB/SusD family nutrient uptake outer membrane protein n=1 Tax=Prevotella sp. GTC17253 TaxID=3236793 RepID=A0AB33IZ88_9BACT
MKYLYLLVVFFFVSCVSLDEEPASRQVGERFYRNEAEALSAVNAVYESLHNKDSYLPMSLYNGLIHITTEMATDDYIAGPRARNAHVRAMASLTYDASNNRVDELWRETYITINRANAVIDRTATIPETEISDGMRSRIINEAKFLRALSYFNLVRWYGSVPLILHEVNDLSSSNLYPAKSSEDSVYVRIVADLEDACQLPAPSEYAAEDAGRATSGAAQALLAKVYLTRGRWQQAAETCEKLMSTHWYSLFPDFSSVFDVAHKNGKEHIFSVQYQGNAGYVGNMLGSLSAAYEVPGINGDYAHAVNPKSGLYAAFVPADKRRAVTFVTSMVSPADHQSYTLSQPHLFKYYDPSAEGKPGESSRNFPVLRYADVLLMYAEALNEWHGSPTAQAYAALDSVRARAGLPSLWGSHPSLSQSAFRDSVFLERRKEFVYEHQRWFDLVRRGADYYVQTLHRAGKSNAAARHIHLPIPQRELDLNPQLKQNPAWEK